MKKTMNRYLVALLSSFFFACTVAQAGPNHNHTEHYVAKLDKKLSLSDAQKASITSTLDANQPAIYQAKKNIKAYKLQMEELLSADTLDEGQIKSVSIAMAEEKANLMIVKTNMKRQINSELTPKQAKIMKKWKKEKSKKHEERHAHNGR